jgi:regulator of sirC expression with transglutaminase-like and TPR domain
MAGSARQQEVAIFGQPAIIHFIPGSPREHRRVGIVYRRCVQFSSRRADALCVSFLLQSGKTYLCVQFLLHH